MAEIKRCVQCRYENPASQIYCLKCGKFLKKSNDNVVSRPTIWSTATKTMVDGIPPKAPSYNMPQIDDKVVICPQCKQVEKTTEDVLPMACSNCGYFFQMDVDKIIDSDKISSGLNRLGDNQNCLKNNGNVKVPSNSQAKKNARKHCETKLRLIVRTGASILPQKINPQGDIIGKNGTVLKQLQTDSQIKINRAPTGWYIEVLEGGCIVQNEHMNKMVERKLKHGDYICIGKYMLFVEITE